MIRYKKNPATKLTPDFGNEVGEADHRETVSGFMWVRKATTASAHR
ncbi:MAG TPA: hypothetical protein VK074_04355 [Fodinibius sp.]|nr:hypothetical protein [Fodinibius sp.]